MIVSCPFCSTKFRLNRQCPSGKRLTLKCVRCQEVFQATMPASSPSSVRVLVAHIDQALCGTVSELLAAEGMECEVCHDGEEALRRMVEEPPQVALLDVALPGLFAFEAVEKIRKLPGLKETGIILLSSVYNRAAYRRSPSSLYGADDYLDRHSLQEELLPKINRLLPSNTAAKSPSTAGPAAGEERGRSSSRKGCEEISTGGQGDSQLSNG